MIEEEAGHSVLREGVATCLRWTAFLVVMALGFSGIAAVNGTHMSVSCGPGQTSTPPIITALDTSDKLGSGYRRALQGNLDGLAAEFANGSWHVLALLVTNFASQAEGKGSAAAATGIRTDVAAQRAALLAGCCAPAGLTPNTPPGVLGGPQPFDPKTAAMGGLTGAALAADALRRAGFPETEIPTFVAIAKHESTFGADLVGPTVDGGTMRGWWQLNDRYWSHAGWRDVYANAVKAKEVRDESVDNGRGPYYPWTTRHDAQRDAHLYTKLAAAAPVRGGKVDVGNGHKVSAVTAQQLRVAEQLAGVKLRVMQGGYGGTHYAASGTSHDYPGVLDVSPATVATEKAMRQAGFAAWARNIPGRSRVGSGAHIHAVSLMDPDTQKSPQVTGSWRRGENGLDGGKDPAPHYPVVPQLQARVAKPDLTPPAADMPPMCVTPASELTDGPVGIGGPVKPVVTLNPTGSGNWQGAVKANGFWYVNEAQDRQKRTLLHRLDGTGREVDALYVEGGAHAVSFGALGNTVYLTFSSCHGLGCSGKGGEQVRSFTYRPGRITKAQTRATGWKGQVGFDPAGTRAVVRNGNKYQAYDLRTRRPIGKRIVTPRGQRQGFSIKAGTVFVLTGPTNKRARVDTYSVATGKHTGTQDVSKVGAAPGVRREPEGIYGDIMGVKSGVGASRELQLVRLTPAARAGGAI